MAWEKRRGRQYFYKSQRVGKKVHKLYYGAGAVAQQAAKADAGRRAANEAEQRAILAEIQQTQPIQQLTSEQEEDARLLFEASMLAAGYRRTNYGRWRRQRAGVPRA